MRLNILDSVFSVVKLPPSAPILSWAMNGELFSITRTDEELSIVLPSGCLPADEVLVHVENDFHCIKIEEGVLDFSLTGIIASVAGPLADAKISVFVMATYNTDYILIKTRDFDKAKAVLEIAGHTFSR